MKPLFAFLRIIVLAGMASVLCLITDAQEQYVPRAPMEGDMPFRLDQTNFRGRHDANLPFFEIHYTKEQVNGILQIKPEIPYFDLLNRGGPIVGVFFFHTVFTGDVGADVDIKLNNSKRQSVYATAISLNVRESHKLDGPIPVFDAFRGKNRLVLRNYGWGSMKSPRIAFAVFSLEECQSGLPPGKGIPLVSRNLNADDTFPKNGPETFTTTITPGDVPGRLKRNPLVCVAGLLHYMSNGTVAATIPFATAVNLIPNPPYLPLPPSAMYQVELEAGRSGYTKEVPISQTLAPETSDFFKLRIIANQSATFQIGMTLRTTDGTSVDLGSLSLEYFRPKGQQMYQNLDVAIDPEFQNLVSSVAENPTNKEDVMVFVTPEFLKASDTDRGNLVKNIIRELRKTIVRAHYCFTGVGGICFESGEFGN